VVCFIYEDAELLEACQLLKPLVGGEFFFVLRCVEVVEIGMLSVGTPGRIGGCFAAKESLAGAALGVLFLEDNLLCWR